MEVKYLMLCLAIVIVLVSGCVQQSIVGNGTTLNQTVLSINADEVKYCEADKDCIPNCGGSINKESGIMEGRGSCINKKYLDYFKNDINCFTEEIRKCTICKCVNNQCTSIESTPHYAC